MDSHTLELLSFADPILVILGVTLESVRVARLDAEGLVLEWEDYIYHSEHIPFSVLLSQNPVKEYETLRNHRRMDLYHKLRQEGTSPKLLNLIERLRSR